MISRVAESCFWLTRHLERAESTARLLNVNRTFVLDIDLPEIERWYPLVIVVGEKERFNKMFSESARHEEELVQEYLTWNEDNPVSIRNSFAWARENARTIREVISLDMWETLNSTWHWLTGGQGRRAYKSDRDKFYREVINAVNLFYGVMDNTLSHERAYDFMRLGLNLERAGQTARTLDVKYHAIGPTKMDMESPIELAQWLALLRSCSARDAYLKNTKSSISGTSIFEFLIKGEDFPRASLHCCLRALNFLQRINPEDPRIGVNSLELMHELVSHLKNTTTQELVQIGIHNQLTHIVDSTMEICGAIHQDYFDPFIPEDYATTGSFPQVRVQTQSQSDTQSQSQSQTQI